MPPKKGKQKEVLSAAEARSLLALLDKQEQLPLESLQRLFRVAPTEGCAPSCGKGSSKGSKDNPSCFHGLVPAENSFRKKGLWQKEPVVGQLGHDPANEKRQSCETPAGLRNLGNTCYVNAAMQFLYSLPDFRHALYVIEPELAAQDIVAQMRDLFIQMAWGPRRCVDPEPFANILQLNHAIQQDGQEFLKLLLQKLEVLFAGSNKQEVNSVVQRLFRGHFSYVTTCQSCRQQSEGSSRQVEYYELPLQVQGMPSLQASMVCALSPEELVGDNQYFCEACGTKCDAERQMRLRSLPPYLCLSMQRFVFDMQTFQKKKASDKMSIPLLLDVGAVLAASGLELPAAAPHGPDGSLLLPGAPGAAYELAAVLIHKGSSASHGHYVAHIKMPGSGTWWRFDDEVAEQMGPQPTSHPADHGTTAQVQAAAEAAATAAAAGGTSTDDGGKAAAAGSKKRGRGGGSSAADAGGKRGRGGRSGSRGRGRGGRGKGRGGRRRKGDPDSDESSGTDTEEAEQAQLEEQEDAELVQALLASREQFAAEQGFDSSDPAMAAYQQQQQFLQQQAAAQPAGRARSRAGAAAGDKAGRGKGRGGRAKASTAAEAVAEAADAAAAAAGAQPVQGSEQGLPDIVSGNAYFLVYRQVISALGGSNDATALAAAAATPDAAPAAAAATPDAAPAAAAAAASGGGGGDAAAAGAGKGDAAVDLQQLFPGAMLQQLQALPGEVAARVAALHREFAAASTGFQQQKQDALQLVTERQQEVRTVAGLLPCSDPSDAGVLISSAWLEAWASSEARPDPVDNGPLLCEHRQLGPDRPPAAFKHISSTAWEALVGAHKGGPKLTLAQACPVCLRGLLVGLVSCEDLAGLRESLLAALLVDEEQQDELDQGGGFYISKTWLNGFRTRRSVAASGSLQPPTAGIVCPHKRLAPASLSGTAKRFVVSKETWDMLKQLWVGQVLQEVAARKAKAVRLAARAAAAGNITDEEPSAAAAANEDEVLIVDSPQQKNLKQEQQQQEQDGDDDVMEVDGSPPHHPQQQQQQLQQLQGAEPAGAAENGGSPDAAAAAAGGAGGGWALDLPLDGSVELSEAVLLAQLPEFYSMTSFDCPACCQQLHEAAAGHQEVKAVADAQRGALKQLLQGSVSEQLEPGRPYYLVPNDWLALWQRHMSAASARKVTNQALPPPPPPLPDAVRGLLCRCHPDCPGLAVEAPAIINRRGRFGQADPQKDLLRVVSQADWQNLLLFHSGLEADEQQQQQQGQAAAGAAAGGGRARRSARARASEQQQQQQQQQDDGEEAQLVLQQKIASMAELDPGFRGIRAQLQVAAPDTAQAPAGEQQHGQQEPGQQQQQNGVAVQPHALPNGTEQQQQQQPSGQPQDVVMIDVVDAGGASGVSVDLTATTPVPAARQAKASAPAAAAAAAAAAAGDGGGDVVMVLQQEGRPDEQPAPVANAVDAAIAAAAGGDSATAAAIAAAMSESDDGSDGDGLGLEEAAAREDEWQPDDGDSSDAAAPTVAAGCSPRRHTRTRRGASRRDAGATSSGGEGGGGAAATAKGWLVTTPAPCEATLAAEAAARRAVQLVYADVEVMVELVGEEELAAAFSAAAGAERKSRRARKNRQPVRVASEDSLHTLKLKVFQVLGVHPKNQRLFKAGGQLQGDDTSLGQLEVFPDEEIRVVNTNEVPNDDYTSVFDGANAGKSRRAEVEVGFRDTVLGSSAGLPTVAAAAAAGTPAAMSADDEEAKPAAAADGAAAGAEQGTT